jgi:hypothetical protein
MEYIKQISDCSGKFSCDKDIVLAAFLTDEQCSLCWSPMAFFNLRLEQWILNLRVADLDLSSCRLCLERIQ